MAAGSGPVRTSIRPNTLSTVLFITAIGLIQTVIGTTITDTIADNQKRVQREFPYERVSAPSQTGRPSPPQLDARVKPWMVHVAMSIALPGLVATAMTLQHVDFIAMQFAEGRVTQIF